MNVNEHKIGSTIYLIQSLNIHGVPKVIRSKNFLLKLWWMSLTFTSATFAIFFIRKTLMEYSRYYVTTEVRLNETNELDFPTITICNSNKLSTNFSLPYLEMLKNQYEDKEKFNEFDLIKDLKWFQVSRLFEKLNITDLNVRKNFTLSIKDMIADCRFNRIDCNYSDFEWIFNSRYGNCYRFNTFSKYRTLRKSNKSSELYGFNLVLNLANQNKILNDLGINRGVFLSIDSPNSNAYYDFNDVIFVSTKTQTNIQIEKTSFHKQPNPYSNCHPDEKDSIYYQKIIDSDYLYSQPICISFCLLDYYQHECGCVLSKSSIRVPNIKYCSSQMELDCTKNIDILNLNLTKSCEEKCPLECDRVKYTSYVTTVPFDNEILLYQLKIGDFNGDFNDYIIMNIYFGSMSFVEYKEYPSISVYGLISSVGGHLGLFLGMSLLSFTELIELVILSISSLCAQFYDKPLKFLSKKQRVRINTNKKVNQDNAIKN